MNTKEAMELGLSRQLRELYEEKRRLVQSLYNINNRIAALKEQKDTEEEARSTSDNANPQGYHTGGIVTKAPIITEGSIVFFTGEQEDAPKKYCITPMEDYQRYDSH